MLQFIQTGLSAAGPEGDATGVARVMDWVEGQPDRYKEGKELDARAESADKASASTSNVWRSFSLARQQARETAEARSPSQIPRQASTASSSWPVGNTPIPALTFIFEATPATNAATPPRAMPTLPLLDANAHGSLLHPLRPGQMRIAQHGEESDRV